MVMMRLSRVMLLKKFLNRGGEMFRSAKPPMITSGRESGRGSLRIWATAWWAWEKVTGNEGLAGLPAQAVRRKGIEIAAVIFNTTMARCGMLGSFPGFRSFESCEVQFNKFSSVRAGFSDRRRQNLWRNPRCQRTAIRGLLSVRTGLLFSPLVSPRLAPVGYHLTPYGARSCIKFTRAGSRLYQHIRESRSIIPYP